MSSQATKSTRRLMKDLEVCEKYKKDGFIYAEPLSTNVYIWVAVIMGPVGTPFENGTFSLALFFDEDYPSNPPEVCFLCPMFHPNVYENGNLCLDILKKGWSPSLDIYGVLLCIQSLLSDPNINSPANNEAAKVYSEDYNKYTLKIKDTVESSWNILETTTKIKK